MASPVQTHLPGIVPGLSHVTIECDLGECRTGLINLYRPVGTYLYGRRMYETMLYWETAHAVPDQPPHIEEDARDRQAVDKIE